MQSQAADPHVLFKQTFETGHNTPEQIITHLNRYLKQAITHQNLVSVFYMPEQIIFASYCCVTEDLVCQLVDLLTNLSVN